MRSAAALGFLLALGIWVGHALAASPPPTLLPTTTLPISTTLPTLPTTTTVPLPLPTTTTVPKLPTTTTVPKLPTTTTVPKLPTTTTVPKLPTTTSVPQLPTTTTATATTPVSQVTTTATSATKTSPVASAIKTAGSVGSSGPTASIAAADALSSGSSASSSGGPAGSSSAPAPNRGAQVQQLEPSRPFISTKGPKSKRRVTLTFVLSRPGRVVFAVRQVYPVCRTVGYFSVRGRKGPNRIRFAGRVGRKRLGPGTYTIFARTREGQLVQRVTLVVVADSTPSRRQLRAAAAANVCSETDAFTAYGQRTASSNFASRGGFGHVREEPSASAPPTVTEAEAPEAGGVLGTTAQKAADAVRPFLVGLLIAAILALGLASLPAVAVPDNRLSELLARHRAEITTIGAAALVAVAVAFLIG